MFFEFVVPLTRFYGLMCSTFSNIFDEFHFIKSLQGDVRILKEVPKEIESLPRARKHFTSWSGVGYYEEMTALWKEYQASYMNSLFTSSLKDIYTYIYFFDNYHMWPICLFGNKND